MLLSVFSESIQRWTDSVSEYTKHKCFFWLLRLLLKPRVVKVRLIGCTLACGSRWPQFKPLWERLYFDKHLWDCSVTTLNLMKFEITFIRKTQPAPSSRVASSCCYFFQLINVTHNLHYSLVYLLGITRPTTTREWISNCLFIPWLNPDIWL